MTFKIETMSGGDGTTIKLIGRVAAECLPELRAELEAAGHGVALEMDEVTLVDLDAVRFLNVCETEGIELRRCPPYIREWIAREQDTET